MSAKTKSKKQLDPPEEKMEIEPPEVEYISAHYVISIPVNNQHIGNPWKLRVYAAEIISRKIGDEVQLTSMKMRKPGPLSQLGARLLKHTPRAKLYITTKF